MYSQAVESSPGSVSQITETAAMLLRFAKETGVPVILIGSLGFWWSKFRIASGENYERCEHTYYDKDETCSSSDCPYRDRKYTNGDYYDHYHTTFYNIFRNKEGAEVCHSALSDTYLSSKKSPIH
jgi:hypothetical protein